MSLSFRTADVFFIGERLTVQMEGFPNPLRFVSLGREPIEKTFGNETAFSEKKKKILLLLLLPIINIVIITFV